MIKKKEKKKKVKLSTLKNKADGLWSVKVKEIHGFKCAICGKVHGAPNTKGKKTYLNSHHIEGRKNYALRWDVLNGIPLCTLHHDLGISSAEQSPLWFFKWLQENRPKLIDYIYSKRESKIEMSVELYLKIIDRLKDFSLTEEEKEIVNFPASFPSPISSEDIPADETPS